MTELLHVARLCKQFGSGKQRVAVLHDINLTISIGEIVGLAGESGSGKSTLARCIAGLHTYDSGEIRFRNTVLPRTFSAGDFRKQAAHVQMIFQDPLASLNPRLTIGDILCEPLRLNSTLSHSAQQALAVQWLQRMGLQGSDMMRYPHSFSGGQLQRIGIARALINQPQLLICDEPVSALDVSVQAQIVNLLLGLREELGLALLFISHDPAMLAYLCDRTLQMQHGHIVQNAN